MAAATEQVKDAVEEGKDKVAGSGGADLGKKLVVSAVAGLGSLAATFAARKGPELLRDHVKPRLEQASAGGVQKTGKQLAGAAKGKLGRGGNGDGGGSGKKTRRLPIQRWTDVAVPIDVAFQRWTEFEEYPKFMHRVLSVEKTDRNKVKWSEKIWFKTRQWEGEITQRRKNDRIAWKTTSGMSHQGIVTFHKLDTSLTRIMVDMDFQPSGTFEKMASGLRFVKRAVQADLARFKAYVELGEAKGLEYGNDEESGRPQASSSNGSSAEQDEERSDD
jgi:hypothetical protein